MKARTVKKVFSKVGLSEQKSDFSYWQTKTYVERINALEEIRREYNQWKYSDAEQRFQRVYQLTKFK